MARIRSIHPNACTSEKLAAVGAEAERCYWRLQTHCDDAGRCEDHPRLVWAALFPLHETITPAKVDGWLRELHDAGLIVRYVSGERRYLQVTQWEVFQHPNHPTPSKIPELSGSPPVVLPEPSGLSTPLVGEGGVDGEGVGDARAALADPFAEWWGYYPRKIDKTAARKAYAAAMSTGATIADLLSAVQEYDRATKGTEARFVKHGATFLHGPWLEWVHGPPPGWAGPAQVPKNSLGLPEIVADIERRRNGNGAGGRSGGAHADDLGKFLPGPGDQAALGRGSDAP